MEKQHDRVGFVIHLFFRLLIITQIGITIYLLASQIWALFFNHSDFDQKTLIIGFLMALLLCQQFLKRR